MAKRKLLDEVRGVLVSAHVRDGKGQKDRKTWLPAKMVEPLKEHGDGSTSFQHHHTFFDPEDQVHHRPHLHESAMQRKVPRELGHESV